MAGRGVTILLSAVIAAAVAAAVARVLISPRWRTAILDHPNPRSLHDTPTPRTGGLAILAGIAAGAAAAAMWHGVPSWLPVPAVALAVVAGVSFVDDRRGLSAAVRLLLQLGTATALVIGGGWVVQAWSLPTVSSIGFGVAAPAITVLAIAWMMNLYNFMDGLDGLAGGMTVSGFGVLAALGWRAGDIAYASTCAAIAGAGAGYLAYNVPPARLFMGDVGSVSLGFAAAALAIQGIRRGLFDGWAAVLAFSPFIVDASIVVTRRAARGEKVWEAHRQHWYQRLVLAGWTRRRTLLMEYGLMLASGAAAVAYTVSGDRGRVMLLTAGVVFYWLLFLMVTMIERGGVSRMGER